MKPSFIAYVDESGDEGFVFNADGSGSSRWFVLSAAVIRQVNDLQMVSCLKEVREVLKKEPKTPLHFVDLKHEQRVPYVRRVGALPIRTVSVLVYKPLITEPEKFQSTKYLLYRYARYWRDTDEPYFSGPNGAGTNKNYTNPGDYALKKWMFDQHTKPDESLGYWYSAAAAAASPQNSGIRRGALFWMRELFWPTGTVDMGDTHEIFAFGIEPRSSALGASRAVDGIFGGHEVYLQDDFFRFGETHDYHSKQFRSTIALQWGFWGTVLSDFGF